jgi:hypothetical protein
VDAMTFRQMNLNIFRGEPVPHVFFQPRIEPWVHWHEIFGQFSDAYSGLDIPAWFDRLDCSMRYVHYYTGMPSPVLREFGPEVQVHERFQGTTGTIVYETPLGDLAEDLTLTPDQEWRVTGFAVKRVEDLKKLRWLYEHTTFRFSAEAFAQGRALVGDRGEPQFWTARSPYQALAIDWMRYEAFIYALADYPEEIATTLDVIDAAYDRLYEELCAAENLHIVNFGENIHGHLIGRRPFEDYLLPFYAKRAGQLKAAGIFSHIHIDGAVRPLLPLLKDLPFDGIEALTPEPQGDVMLEEIAAHIGDKILLDGIPAVYFMDTYPREALLSCVERLVDLFHPRLILGVSDEVPEGASEEAIERVRLIADWCREHP